MINRIGIIGSGQIGGGVAELAPAVGTRVHEGSVSPANPICVAPTRLAGEPGPEPVSTSLRIASHSPSFQMFGASGKTELGRVGEAIVRSTNATMGWLNAFWLGCWPARRDIGHY